jgi:hypothetical protein
MLRSVARIAAIFGIFTVGTRAADEAPVLYLSAAEIADVKARVEAGKEPWHAAHDAWRHDAEKALAHAGDYSVVRQGHVLEGGSPHDYCTDAVYRGWKRVDGKDPDRRDGQINPHADRADYEAAVAFGRDVRDLGLAYALTGEERYAKKAAALLEVWCVAPETRMTPRFPNMQSHIELSITMPDAIYGAAFLARWPGWPAEERAAVTQWVGDFASEAQHWAAPNNFDNWRVVVLAAAGAYLEDQAMLETAWARFRANIGTQMNDNGSLKFELTRVDALTYSAYALNAMMQAAEIARHHGVDLYHFTLPDGRGLERCLDFHAPYLADPARWVAEGNSQHGEMNAGSAAVYELALREWPAKPAYRAVLQRWPRPLVEERIIGPITLTHAAAESLK